MTLSEIKDAILVKSMELELALEEKVPHEELLKKYKELKDLQFQKVQAELSFSQAGEPA